MESNVNIKVGFECYHTLKNYEHNLLVFSTSEILSELGMIYALEKGICYRMVCF